MRPVSVIASPHAHAVVHLDAVAHNTALFAAGTTAAVMAVVKADGFGHGAVRVAGAALSSGATWLGVTTCAEALHLRAGGVTAPILSWMHSPLEDFGAALLADVDLSVSSREHLRAVAASAARLGVTAEVHLKADTGLHRNGARPGEWRELVRLARDLETTGHVRVRGVWSHLVSGTEAAEDTTRAQVRLFDEAVGVARGAGLRPEIRHLANSAATLGRGQHLPRLHQRLPVSPDVAGRRPRLQRPPRRPGRHRPHQPQEPSAEAEVPAALTQRLRRDPWRRRPRTIPATAPHRSTSFQ